jgi:type VI secretion system protein ImpF
MAAANQKNRLSPPLMYAFRAAFLAHDAKSGAAHSATRKETAELRSRIQERPPISEAIMRAEVARDLEALMNNIALQSTLPLVDFPAVAKSVLNYGFPDITHRSIDELGGADIGTEIEQALRTYEPRLARNTIHVVRDTSIDPADLKIRYIVRGELRSRPLNVPIEFIADVEVTTGNIVLRRLT